MPSNLQKSRVIKSEVFAPHFLLLAKSDFLAVAEAEGFEPSSRLLGYLISSQARYDHFDTLPYESPEIFRGFLIVDVDYLFENCGALLAFLRPYFFLSFALGSLVKKPAFFKDAFVSSSARTNALEIPCLIAPA